MLESLINPKSGERKTWQLFFVGLLYSIISVIIANYLFKSDPKYIGIWIVTFTVILCMPFVYFLFKYEEKKDLVYEGNFKIFLEHQKAIMALTFLFLGFLIGYTLCYSFLPKEYFLPQIETFCSINRASNYDGCVNEYVKFSPKLSGFVTNEISKFLSIFTNNMMVFILTFIFSIILGAGGIFILAWNASVIASAIGIYIKSDLTHLLYGLSRYMIHGIPEIAAYLIAALAGGILSMMIIRGDHKNKRFLDVLQNVLILLITGILILVFAGLIEVFITPVLFKN